jgi:hypothetical protein
MKASKRETFEPVTLGHVGGHGCHDLLVCIANPIGATTVQAQRRLAAP